MAADLTAVAEANGPARRAAADAMCAADGTGRLAQFREFAGRSAFATNVLADKVVAFDEIGEVADSRRLHLHWSGGDPDAGRETFVRDQDTWLRPREAFEDLWEHGRRLVYGALNAGGRGGIQEFGGFCLVMEDPTVGAPEALAVFPGDSAQRYVDPTGLVLDDMARSEATAWDDRGSLVAVERHGDARASAEGEWSVVVCEEDRYFEVARAGSLPLDRVQQVRIRSMSKRMLDDLFGDWAADEIPSADGQALVSAYRVLLRWQEDSGIPIVEVE